MPARPIMFPNGHSSHVTSRPDSNSNHHGFGCSTSLKRPFPDCNNLNEKSASGSKHLQPIVDESHNSEKPAMKRGKLPSGFSASYDTKPIRQRPNNLLSAGHQFSLCRPSQHQSHLSARTPISIQHEAPARKTRDGTPRQPKITDGQSGQGGRIGASPFVNEDSPDEEHRFHNRRVVKTQSTFKTILQPADARTEERQKSHRLREEAMGRKRDLALPSTPLAKEDSTDVIDLCSPTSSTFLDSTEDGVETMPQAINGSFESVESSSLIEHRISDTEQLNISVKVERHQHGRTLQHRRGNYDTSTGTRSFKPRTAAQTCVRDPSGNSTHVLQEIRSCNSGNENRVISKDRGFNTSPRPLRLQTDKFCVPLARSVGVAECEDDRAEISNLVQKKIRENKPQDGYTGFDKCADVKTAVADTLPAASKTTGALAFKEDEPSPRKQVVGACNTHTTSGPPVRSSVLSTDATQQRYERVKKKLLRNQQNRESAANEESDEDDVADPSLGLIHRTSHATQLPMVRDSIQQDMRDGPREQLTNAFQKPVVPGSNVPGEPKICSGSLPSHGREQAAACPGNHFPKKKSKRGSHQRLLGEILWEDVQLVQWKQAGMSGLEMEQHYERSTGKKRVLSTLVKRCRQVQNAFSDAGLPGSIIDEAASGDHESLERINTIIRGGQGKVQNETKNRPCAPSPSRDARSNTGITTLSNPNNSQPLPRGEDQDTSATPFRRQDKDPDKHVLAESKTSTSEQTRPTLGGKSIRLEDWLDILRDPCGDLDGSTDPANYDEQDQCSLSEFHDEIDDEDMCHFVYRVERRDCTKEDMDSGAVIDDMQWIECSNSFESLARTNAAAAKEVYRSFPGQPRFADPDGDFIVSQQTDEQGLKIFVLENQRAGIVQTRVRRNMRSFHEGILPSSSEGMARRTGYLVRWRITRSRAGDELFGEESQQSIEEANLNAIFTSSDIANQQAIHQYVELTFKSTAANLDVRRQQKQQMIKALGEETDGSDDKFSRISGASTEKQVEVWVEALPIKGPRNIF